MKIHPRFSGGNERIAYIKNGLHISVFEPIYGGVTGKDPEGFVQVKFTGTNGMPGTITEDIDYDLNGDPDFNISIQTGDGTTTLEKLNTHVQSVQVSSKVKDYWLVRVNVVR
jgi:hypothetical protein